MAKPLDELSLSASERVRLEYDGLRYRALINAMEAGDVHVRLWHGGGGCFSPTALDAWLDGVLNRKANDVMLLKGEQSNKD